MNRENETSLDIKNELNKNLNKISLKSDTSIVSELEIRQQRTFASYDAAIQNQDTKFRDKIIEAVATEIKSKAKTRKDLMIFYVCYTSIVTVLCFYILIWCKVDLKVQIILVSTLLVNILSIMMVMVKYAFSDEKWLIKRFNKIDHYGKYSKRVQKKGNEQ